MLSIVDDTNRIINGEIVPGNHDSITIYGCNLQNEVSNLTRMMVRLLSKRSMDYEKAVSDVLKEFHNVGPSKTDSFLRGLFLTKEKKYIEMTKECNTLLNCVEKVVLNLKMQQVQIIKDKELLSAINSQLVKCNNTFKQNIEYAEIVLEDTKKKHDTELKIFSEISSAQEMQSWIARLERKIEDLRITFVVSEQTICQLKNLIQNDLLLESQITNLIRNGFPVWKKQIYVLLEIIKNNQKIREQNQLLGNVQVEYKELLEELKNKQINQDTLKGINIYMTEMLTKLDELEKNDLEINGQMQLTINKQS